MATWPGSYSGTRTSSVQNRNGFLFLVPVPKPKFQVLHYPEPNPKIATRNSISEEGDIVTGRKTDVMAGLFLTTLYVSDANLYCMR
jgi:hypothetical protein